MDLFPHYNIAPSQQIVAVRIRPDGGGREFALLRWGFVPSWAKDPSIGYKMINARSETAPEKPAFRNAFKYRRCLIPASGFYEWAKKEKVKQPYHISLCGKMGGLRPVVALGGLWERWEGEDAVPLESCTILTTEANELLAPIHDRMPLILSPENYELWLTGQDVAALRSLLAPFPPEKMEARPVSRRVNDPSVDNESLLAG